MQMMKVNDLIPHPRNTEFFDDMTGEKWNEFLESVKTSGVIEPIVITQDKVIVSGHQRVRACKELGIDEVLANTKHYDNDDAVLKDLIETNVRQRGSIGGSDIKLGNRIRELERIYGIKHGNNQHNEDRNNVPTQQDLAKQLGISERTLRNAKALTSLPIEIQDLVEQGTISPSTASRLIARLTPEEQEKLVIALPVVDRLTQKQVQTYIDQIQAKDNQINGYKMKAEKDEQEKASLREELEQERQKEPEVKIVDNTDYDKIEQLESQVESLKNQKHLLEAKAKMNQDEINEYRKLKSDIEFLSKEKESLTRQLQSATDLANLTFEAQKFLENSLAPIKFKRFIEQIDISDTVRTNLQEVVDKVQSWVDEMNKIMTNQLTDAEMEKYVNI